MPITALREISILRSLKHENIINVIDVAVGEKAMDEVYMVMEYAEQVGNPLLKGFTWGSPRARMHLAGLLFLHQAVEGVPFRLEL